MSKSLTIVELKEALAPIIASLKKLEEAQAQGLTNIHELYMINTNLSTKLDLLDQKNNYTEPVAAAKKTKKAPAKKTKIEDPVEEDDADPAELVEQPEPEPEKKKAAPEKKKSIKITKTAEKKAKDAEAKAAKPLNKMEFFNLKFNEDPSYFDLHITETDKKSIAEAHAEAWEGLTDKELHAKKRAAYYHFMKDNKDKFLIAMKEEYADSRNKKMTIVDKEES